MKVSAILGLALALSAAASASPHNGSGDGRLARVIGDRVAEPAIDCVPERWLQDNEGVEGAIVFRTRSSNLIYVNQPPGSCPDLNRDRAFRIRTPSTRLCRGDVIEVFDPHSQVEYGGCGLGDFTPYRRPSH